MRRAREKMWDKSSGGSECMGHGFVGLRVKHLRMDEQVRVFNNERLGFRIQLIVVLVGGLKSLTKSVRRLSRGGHARVVTTRHNMTRQDHHRDRADKGPCYEAMSTQIHIWLVESVQTILSHQWGQYTVQTKSIIAPISTQS